MTGITFMTETGTENMIEKGGITDQGKEIERSNNVATVWTGKTAGQGVGAGKVSQNLLSSQNKPPSLVASVSTKCYRFGFCPLIAHWGFSALTWKIIQK